MRLVELAREEQPGEDEDVLDPLLRPAGLDRGAQRRAARHAPARSGGECASSAAGTVGCSEVIVSMSVARRASGLAGDSQCSAPVRRKARSATGAPRPCSRGQGSIRTPGLRIPFGSSSALAARSAAANGCRALAVVPGAVIAADRVVVGDRAARFDHRLRGRGLDLVPLLDLAAAHRRGEHREVGRRPVRIDVGEAAADPRRAGALGRARRRPRRPWRGPPPSPPAWKSSKRSQVIADSKVSERTPQATKVSRR